MDSDTWYKTIESWGFEFVDDYTCRHIKNNNGKEISIMSFEDDEFEVAWINENGNMQERSGEGIEGLKVIIDSIDDIQYKEV